MKPTILFTTPVLRHPPNSGPTLRVENAIRALSQVCSLYLYSRVPLADLGGVSASSYYQQYCRRLYFDPHATSLRRYARRARMLLNSFARLIMERAAWDVAREESGRSFDHLLGVADAVQADVIWLGYGNISYAVLDYIKQHSGYKVVLDTDSVWSKFILRGLPYASRAEDRRRIAAEGALKEEEERVGARLADVTTAVSEVDAEYYRSLCRDPSRVHVFSNALDFDAYADAPRPPAGFRKPSLCLAGSFWRQSPMEDGARWVLNKVMPLLRDRIPGVHLYLVGIGSDRVLRDETAPDVTKTGQVTSVLPYLCHVDVALVPLRFESGTRFKILEAGACGVPVVSTTLGAEGIPVMNGEHILLADDPAEFAAAIIRLIEDRDYAATMAQALKRLVRERNGIPSLVSEAKGILAYLASSNPM